MSAKNGEDMREKWKSVCPLILLFLLQSPDVQGEKALSEICFNDQKITDILLVLAREAKVSIVPDETVSGNASYFFSDMEFGTALTSFLSAYDLYAEKREGIYYVSRIRSRYDKQTGELNLDAESVQIRHLLDAISRSVSIPILYDSLPRTEVTIHGESMTASGLLEILSKRLPEHQLIREENYFYFKREERAPTGNEAGVGTTRGMVHKVERHENGSYTIEIDRERFDIVLKQLFNKEGREYSLLMQSNTLLENLFFSNKGFESILRLLCEQGNADYTVENGMYYFFELNRRDILKHYKSTEVLSLVHVSAQDLQNAMPSDLTAGSFIRIDKENNIVILRGSEGEIAPIRAFIKTFDQPRDGQRYIRFDIVHMKVRELLKILPQRFNSLQHQVLEKTNSLVFLITDAQAEELKEFIQLVDSGSPSIPITLKYIKTDELLSNLPPSVDEGFLISTHDDRKLFYTGPPDCWPDLQHELDIIDTPVPQIQYELLVMQYQEGENVGWDYSVENSVINEENPKSTFLGNIGRLVNLNFDIVSAFGYSFAVQLNMDIGERKARVMADTTLNGLSGQELKFQNTNTYRYRDYEVDPDTGELEDTGITREITSGLILDIGGWVSGDNMITMDVAATVSKQVSSDSGSSSNLPTTTEKVVNTHVRTPVGEPVIIGGLIQQDKDVSINKIPILGSLPFIGRLFQMRSETIDNTEMVIYILPHIEYPEDDISRVQKRLDALYKRFFQGGMDR